jgi:type I restriction enzyme S subunit
MNEWKEVIIDDICEVTSSKRIFYEEYVNSGIPFFRSKEVIELSNKQDVSTDLFIKEEKYNSIKDKFGAPSKDDILLTSVGTLGVPYIVPGSFEFYFKDGNLTWFRKWSNQILPNFFYWWLKSPQGFQSLLDTSIGSTQPALTISGLKKISLNLPPRPEQERIAEVLSSLDDKIDLLQRNNKTLEQLAETLFRQWFVEEAEESKLSDEFNVIMGQSPPGDTYNETGNGIIFYQGRTDFGFRFPKPRIYCTHPTRFAESLDTLMSVRAPVGDINYAAEKCCIGRGIAAIRHKNKDIHHSYTYYLMKYLRSDFDVHEDTGTIFGSINKDELLSIKCPKLDINNIPYFNSSIGSLDDKIVSNCSQIQQLETLRDTLLPKLMSGVVRVNE